MKKWPLRITATCLFIVALLIGIALNPMLLYANSTTDNNYTIYHQQPLPPAFITQLNNADKLLRSSELYDRSLKLEVCLNDGSYYPKLMESFRGQAFGWGFQHKLIIMGNMNAAGNYVTLNGYKWNLTELVAHEITHCLQYNRYGLLLSNPIAHLPEWKWEGYPEYVARKREAGLVKNITHLLKTEQTNNNNWITFDDSTGTVIPYYKYWLLVQYCIDIRKMTYDGLLKDTARESTVTKEMMAWYLENR